MKLAQGIDGAKAVRDKQLCPPLLRLHHAVGGGGGLQDPAGGCAYRNHAAAPPPGCVDLPRRLFINAVKFPVHAMLPDIFHFYRLKGTRSNMQGDEAPFNPFFTQTLKDFWRKMKTGGGSGRRTVLSGINGLVMLRIFQGVI